MDRPLDVDVEEALKAHADGDGRTAETVDRALVAENRVRERALCL